MSRKSSSAVVWTMILHFFTDKSGDCPSFAGRSFMFEGEPTQKDLEAAPIQHLRFNDGIRTVHALIYSEKRVSETLVKGYVESWRRGEWFKLDLKKLKNPRKTVQV